MTTFVQYLIDGIALGSLYVLVAMGFTLVFGVMGLLNAAHADLLMVAVFAEIGLSKGLSFGVVLAAICGVMAAAALGLVIFEVILRRVDHTAGISLFIGTIGASYVIENVVSQLASAQTRSVTPLFETHFYHSFGLEVSNAQIVLVVATLAIAGALGTWLTRSRTGADIRAVAESRTLASLVGIDTTRVMMVTVLVASLIAGVGGVLYANSTLSLSPFVADSLSIRMFVVAIVAGVGNVGGAVLVGLVLGVVESLTVGYVGSEWQAAIGLIAMIVVLLARPQGLFGRQLRVG